MESSWEKEKVVHLCHNRNFPGIRGQHFVSQIEARQSLWRGNTKNHPGIGAFLTSLVSP